jgi:hypothetical protein
MRDSSQNDRSQYLNDGFRDPDAREGFGDDGGTRVGRPDGAGSNHSGEGMHASGDAGDAQPAPHDVSGKPRPGQAGTNAGPVPDGLEGSLQDDGTGGDAAQGDQQSRVQRSAEGLNQGRAAGDDRPAYDL